VKRTGRSTTLRGTAPYDRVRSGVTEGSPAAGPVNSERHVDDIEIPALLADALARDTELRQAWEDQTAESRFRLAHRIASALRPDTQRLRLSEVIAILRGRQTRQTTPARPGRRVKRPDRSDD